MRFIVHARCEKQLPRIGTRHAAFNSPQSFNGNGLVFAHQLTFIFAQRIKNINVAIAEIAHQYGIQRIYVKPVPEAAKPHGALSFPPLAKRFTNSPPVVKILMMPKPSPFSSWCVTGSTFA